MSAVTGTLGEQALDAVHRDPELAHRLAEEALAAADLEPAERVRGLWARGMARRERDDLGGAAEDLAAARAAALAGDDPAQAARIDVTRSLVVMYSGKTAEALDLLAGAAPHLGGPDLARLEMQRGLLEHRMGRLDDALASYRSALTVLSSADDRVALTRLHANLGVLHVYRDEPERAIDHCRTAAALADELGQDLLAAGALHNLGYAEARRGNIVDALDALEHARRRYDALPPTPMRLALEVDYADVLADANLLGEARSAADTALVLTRESGNATGLADAALRAAHSRLADGDPDGALQAIREARELFMGQERTAWLPMVDLLELRAGGQAAVASGERAARAADVADALDRLGWRHEAFEASLLSVRESLAAGDVEAADVALSRLARRSRRVPAVQRAAVHLARALVVRARGDDGRARRHVTDGLATLAENHAALGATELRAHALAHGAALVDLGVELAVEARRPREVLGRIERGHGILDVLPRPTAQPGLDSLLGELRAAAAAVRTAEPDERVVHQARLRELETEIRRRSRTARGGAPADGLGVGELVDALGTQRLVAFVPLHGELWAVSVANGRCRLHALGTLEQVQSDVETLLFGLARRQRDRLSPASSAAAADLTAAASETLAEKLLGPALRGTTSRLVVVPSAALATVPWTAVGAAAGCAISVVPSLAAWARADGIGRVPRRRRGAVALIGGPDLAHADEELDVLAALHGPEATISREVDAALAAVSRSSLAHVACHGRFRADNPMFSSLRLVDGELTIHDLERATRVPHTIVLSACDAGQGLALRGGALLGMATALMQLGVADVIAPVTPVSDRGSVAFVERLHRRMLAGDDPATALATAVRDPSGDLDATGAAFVCFGA